MPAETILFSGASGFIGAHVSRELASDGYRIARLARPRSRPLATAIAEVAWDPSRDWIDRDALQRLAPQLIINLAGARIDQRWTRARRLAIRESRVNGTRLLAAAIAQLPTPPRALLSGSAVGYYGAHRGDELLTEDSAPGDDFLAETALAWENALAPATAAGIRVVRMRTGVVLGRNAGALKRLLLPFRLGLGGRMGSGRQWMSWIALSDVAAAMRHIIRSDTLSGAVNLAAPQPVQNRDFTRAMGRVLRRPALLPVPAIALQLLFGTMARNTILASQRVMPARLLDDGFRFAFPDVELALRHELSR